VENEPVKRGIKVSHAIFTLLSYYNTCPPSYSKVIENRLMVCLPCLVLTKQNNMQSVAWGVLILLFTTVSPSFFLFEKAPEPRPCPPPLFQNHVQIRLMFLPVLSCARESQAAELGI
jgi:hypothetical protein